MIGEIYNLGVGSDGETCSDFPEDYQVSPRRDIKLPLVTKSPFSLEYPSISGGIFVPGLVTREIKKRYEIPIDIQTVEREYRWGHSASDYN